MSKLFEQINKTNNIVGEFCSAIFSGGTPNTTKSSYWNGNIPWLSSGETRNDYINQTEKTITDDGVKNSSTRLAKKGDIVIATAGQGLTRGQISFLNIDTYINQSLISLRADNKNLDSKYLFYNLKSRYSELRSLSDATSSRGSITCPMLYNLDINIPDYPTQKKIASILGAYDEKIENNNKIIKNLEETAQTIFNEWFVNFKFPGYGKVKMIDSEMGEIPEGWEIKKISELFTVILGGTPSREKPECWNGNIPWINSGEINKLRILEATEHITELGLNKSNARLIKSGATVLAITGTTLGQVSRLEIDSTANQSVIGIYDENNVLNEYLYLYILSNIHDLISSASGGAQQHINKQIVEDYDILNPSDDVIKDFNKKINSFFLLIKKLFEENISLKSQRDLLLVKLI